MIFFVKKYKIQIGLAVIAAVGFFLRFWNLASQGFFYPDEGQYLLSVTTLSRVPAAFWKVAFLPFGEWSAALRAFFPAGFFEFIQARPGFILVDVIGVWIFGFHEYAPRFVNAVFGMATIFVAYFLGRDNFGGKKAGLLTAAFIAVSKYNVFFSRTGESHLVSGFFFILSVWLWLKTVNSEYPRKKYLILSGLMFGFLATTHYMNFLVLAFAFVFEFAALFWKRERHSIKDFFIFLAAGLALPIFWFIVLWAKARIINSLGFFDSDYSSLSYWGQLQGVWSDAAGLGSLVGLKTFPLLISRLDGWLLAALFTLAPLLLLWKKYRLNLDYFYIIVLSYYPIVLLSISPWPVPYAIATFYPAIIILCAFILVKFYNRIKSRAFQLAAVFVLSFSLASMLVSSFRLTELHMPYNEAVKFLQERGIKPEEIIAFSWAPYQFLLQAPIAASQKNNFLNDKYKYYISDPEDNYWGMETEAIFGGYIRRNLKPLAEFRVNYGGTFPDFINWTGITPKSPEELKYLENSEINSTIRIYDISGLDFSKLK